MKNCTLLWHEADFKVEMLKKTPQVRTTFGSKVHGIVARTFLLNLDRSSCCLLLESGLLFLPIITL